MSVSDVLHKLIDVAAGRHSSLSPDEADELHASVDEDSAAPAISADEAPGPVPDEPVTAPEPAESVDEPVQVQEQVQEDGSA